MIRTMAAIVALACVLAASAAAYDAEDFRRLAKTNRCYQCDLSRISLAGQNWFFALLREADLRGAEYVDGRMNYSNLAQADLRGADFSATWMRFSILHGANMAGGTFIETDFTGAYMVGADLRGAVLAGSILGAANLRNVDLTGADLFKAKIYNADLRGARGLTQRMLDRACGANTQLPAGLKLYPC